MLKSFFHVCVSISIAFGTSNQARARFWFSFPIIWLTERIRVYVNGAASHFQRYFTKPEGLCECERVYMPTCTVYVGAYACLSVCDQLCLYFPSLPVLPRRNHPAGWFFKASSEGQVKRTASGRGAVIITWSPSADQMMGEAGWGIAVRFTFSSTQRTILLWIWL